MYLLSLATGHRSQHEERLTAICDVVSCVSSTRGPSMYFSESNQHLVDIYTSNSFLFTFLPLPVTGAQLDRKKILRPHIQESNT
jgi:hypothetical protein